ncbi:MAG: hypothetical protein AB1746_13445 [Candidatus Zixiibacteriota bacterium]
MKTKIIIIAVLVFVLAISCRTRLGSVLYEIDGENQTALSQKETYYQVGFDLDKSSLVNPLINGKKIVLISRQNAAHPEKSEIATGLITSTGEIEYRVYVPIPFINEGESLNVSGKSFCRLIGLFDIADSLKHYECREGYIKIDTVKPSRFVSYLSGKYYNRENDSLILEGHLNAVRKK